MRFPGYEQGAEPGAWEAERAGGLRDSEIGGCQPWAGTTGVGTPPGMAQRYQSTKKAPTKAGAFLQLVPETGVEPATYALRMRRSTN